MSGSPVVLGVDFGGSKVAAAVADLTGSRLAAAQLAVGVDDAAEQVFAQGVGLARELLRDAAGDRPLVGVGAATFGIPGEDGVALAPTINGWEQLAFGRLLRDAFPGVAVRAVTDVKAAAHAEARSGSLAGADPAIYLNLGTGLAVALVTGGSVLHGCHGAAGEIGYNLRALSDVGAGATERVILESAVSGRALDRAVPVGDFVTELAFHLVNLTIAIDPQRIAVGGGVVRSWQLIEHPLRSALAAAVPFPPELVLARFPFDAPLQGALAFATEAARESLSEGVHS